MIAHLLTSYYVLSAAAGLSGSVLLLIAANKAVLPLRPWCAAAVPAAAGFFVVNIARLIADNDTAWTHVARGLSLYGMLVLYNALPYAAIHHAHLTPVVLDEFVAEVGRQLNDTGEIPIQPGGDGAA